MSVLFCVILFYRFFLVSAAALRSTTVGSELQLAKDDYNKAIEAHESGSHVEVIGEIEDNGKRKKLMTAESFSIID